MSPQALQWSGTDELQVQLPELSLEIQAWVRQRVASEDPSLDPELCIITLVYEYEGESRTWDGTWEDPPEFYEEEENTPVELNLSTEKDDHQLPLELWSRHFKALCLLCANESHNPNS